MLWSVVDVHVCPSLPHNKSRQLAPFPQELAASPKAWPDIFSMLTLLTSPGTRQRRLMYLPCLLWGSVGPYKATGSHDILQQCLTEEKTPFVFLDKRINKIKRLSNHQWKITCHFDSTRKHEARANSSFHLSCNASIPALNGNGCHHTRGCPIVWHDGRTDGRLVLAFPIKHWDLSKQSWAASFSLLQEIGKLFSHFICIIAGAAKSVVWAEDHSTGPPVDRIQRAQCALACRWARQKGLCINCSHHKRTFANGML